MDRLFFGLGFASVVGCTAGPPPSNDPSSTSSDAPPEEAAAAPSPRGNTPSRSSPEARATASGDDTAAMNPIVVTLDRDGVLHFGERVVGDRAELKRAAVEFSRTQPGGEVVIRSDANVAHGRVVEVLDTLKEAGIARVSFDTAVP
ncbi:MAG: biopolymer transporter ExbD [Myxococcota bacterium]